MRKTIYLLEKGTKEIVRKDTVSRRPLGFIDESEVAALLELEGVRFFLHAERETLEALDASDLRERWADEYAGHVTSDAEASVREFPRGCFYLAERWKGDSGRPIVILHCHH